MNSKTASTRANSPVRKARVATIEIEVTAFLGIAQRSRGGGARPAKMMIRSAVRKTAGWQTTTPRCGRQARLQQHELPIAGNDEILDLLVGIAGLQQFPYEHAQI